MSPRPRRPRAREALRSGPRPLPGSPCPAPAVLHPEDLPPGHGAAGARPGGTRMRTPSEAGASRLGWRRGYAGPLGGARALC